MFNRRQILAIPAAASMAAALSVPSMAAPQAPWMPVQKPRRLRTGDTVGLISPASASDEAYEITFAEEAIRAMGMVPKRGANIAKQYGYFAGEDKARAQDVNAMFADKSVTAIMAMRGGWGAARILPYLDFNMIRANPKPLIGFSDITALHMALQAKTGMVSFHGPNAGSAWGNLSLDSFRPLLFDAQAVTYANPPARDDRLVQRRWRTHIIQGGKASGRLIGGNLSVITSLAGTPYMPDMKGAILFVEDVDEAQYRIDRMLTQLGQAGYLSGLSGFIFGQCNNCSVKDDSINGFTLSSVLEQHIKPLGIPAFQGAFFGHMADQFTLPIGINAEIDAAAGTIRMLEAAVT
jgi:muramoyltetrapeptide carboxypeptidase